MRRRLFEDLVLSSRTARGRGRAYTLPVSFAIHAAVMSAAIVVPVMTSNEIPTPVVSANGWYVPVTLMPAPPPPTQGDPRPRQGDDRSTPRPAETAPVVAPVEVLDLPPAPEANLVGEGPGEETSSPSGCLGCAPGGIPSLGSEGRPGGTVPVVRPGGQIQQPSKVRDVPPVYPELAKAAGVQGVVIIECTISPEGRVLNAQILRGHPLLDTAALEAVKQWVYRPTLLNGQPVAVIMTVTVRFTLRR
ncbi:MAG: energy transducer TonB [Acidobacteria bacterium]|nr:energy transducer TonB [Acidobacteriota bacterium]